MPYTTYAIGDIHGRADLLAAMVQEIEMDAAAQYTKARIIFLGDIVDKGPSSCQAKEIVADVLQAHPHSRLIIGNHDDRFFEFVSGRSTDAVRYAYWVARMHGITTLQSYGFSENTGVADLAARFKAKFSHHLSVLRDAERIIIDPRFAFVHAGINPTRPLDDQSDYDLMWIRDEFIGVDHHLPRVFVHGHTPTATHFPEFHRYRINLDTGACGSDRLCCLAVDANENTLRTLYAEGSGPVVNLRWKCFDTAIETGMGYVIKRL